jgi:hypothetical protein
MEISKKFFTDILLDNDQIYFDYLYGVIESVDELASLEISKYPEAYHFRLIPSLSKYTNMLIKEIVKMHNLFSIHIEMSKSIKSSGSIIFKINLNKI